MEILVRVVHRLWRATLGHSLPAFVLIGSACVLATAEAQAQPVASKEYQLKAACLLHFAHFAEWPADAFASADAPFRIGVLGEDPFGLTLDEIVRGETAANRKIEIVRSRRVEDIKSCQLVFISKSERLRLPEIFSSLDSAPVLTVGEVDGFARRGGIINFYVEANKVRFEINPAAARRKGLKLSSQLLALGKIVLPDSANRSPAL